MSGLLFLILAIGATAQTANLFVDDNEFRMFLRKNQLEIEAFDITPESVSWATNVEISALAKLVSLEPILTFMSQKTGLPLSFVLERQPAADGFALVRSDLDGEVRSDLHIGVTHRDDDFRISFSTAIHHESTNYVQVFAFGVLLHGNLDSTTETLRVFDTYGNLIEEFKEIPGVHNPVGTRHTFLGITSTTPIGAVEFDENGNDKDVISLQQLVFGVRATDLLTGVPSQLKISFWFFFNAFIVFMLGLDLLFLNGPNNSVRLRDALKWSFIWIMLALAFAGAVYVYFGRGPAIVWITSYLLEKFLSVDNLFVFLTIFASFKTPVKFQHRVLNLGIIGAIVLRAVFIFTGVLLVDRFTWVLAFFGLFLLYAGAKALYEEGCGTSAVEVLDLEDESNGTAMRSDEKGVVVVMETVEPEQLAQLKSHILLRILRVLLPVADDYDPHGRFIVDDNVIIDDAKPARASIGGCLKSMFCFPVALWSCLRGHTRYKATPLLAVLVIIEATDMVFAADSIPAVLSITQDPFIAYTSNIFAVLGLRALYFALAAAMSKFAYLATGLGVILVFIGLKMLLAFEDVHISIETTLFFVLGTLSVSVLYSVFKARAIRKFSPQTY